MRQKRQLQPTLQEPWVDADHAKELQAIARLLDKHPTLSELIWQDLQARGAADPTRGRSASLTAEQVLRVLIVKQLSGLGYRDLAFHLIDSLTYRRFCLLGVTDNAPSKSALHEAIKAIRPETMEAIHRVLISSTDAREVEPARQVRVDSTVVKANIHHPTDSGLLWDCIRTLTRLMKKARELQGEEIKFNNRLRRAKRRHIGILDARRTSKRQKLYLDLIRVAKEVRQMAMRVVDQLTSAENSRLAGLAMELQHFLEMTEKVLAQTCRRIINGESVPVDEKIVSIFEDHTDIIVKARRETQFGHKVFLTSGPSSLILDCLIQEGNPADSALARTMIDRQSEIFSKPPRQAAFDGGFASRANLKDIKELGVNDVVFSKRRGIPVADMAKSPWVYRRLKRFRAGIEGNISFLKRIFGLDRCMWRSWPSFKSYVWSSILTFNLVVLARHLLS